MVEKIKEIKDKTLAFMERELTKYGSDRMDVKQMGELADIVKDLAEAEKSCWEAEYYRTVSEAMEGGSSGSSGYQQPMGRMGYGSGSQSGMQSGGRRGYGSGSMGHTDPISMIRDMMMTGTPETQAKIRGDLSNILGM